MLEIDFDWDSVPYDTHYYDLKLRTPLKQENDIIWEWNGIKWIRSTDYTSWIPISKHMLPNPECSSLLSK